MQLIVTTVDLQCSIACSMAACSRLPVGLGWQMLKVVILGGSTVDLKAGSCPLR